MGTLVGGTTQTLFETISFAGAGYLFQHLNKSGYEKELNTHNGALEQLAKAKETFYENEVRNRNRIQELIQQLSDANNNITRTNKALSTLKKVQSVQLNSKEPVI